MDLVARRLVQRALALTARSGDTLVTLKRTLVDEEAARGGCPIREAAHFDALVAALTSAAFTSSNGCVSVLSVAAQRTGVMCAVHVPDAARLERAALAAVADGTLHLAAVAAEDVASGTDAASVAEQVLCCGLYAVSVVTAGAVSKARALVVRSALAALGGAHELDYLPYVRVEEARSVAAERRQLIVVDRAHLLGTAQWTELLRCGAARIVAVGCPVLRGPSPGLTLADLFRGSAPSAAAASARETALRLWAAAASKWPAATTPLVVLKVTEPVLLFDPPTREMGEAARRRCGSGATLSTLPLGPPMDGPLVCFDASLRALTLSEWLTLLVYGPAPRAIVGTGAAAAAANYEKAIRDARHFPRRLAMYGPVQ